MHSSLFACLPLQNSPIHPGTLTSTTDQQLGQQQGEQQQQQGEQQQQQGEQQQGGQGTGDGVPAAGHRRRLMAVGDEGGVGGPGAGAGDASSGGLGGAGNAGSGAADAASGAESNPEGSISQEADSSFDVFDDEVRVMRGWGREQGLHPHV